MILTILLNAFLSTKTVQNTTWYQWRIQDLQTGGAKVERCRREYRGAEGAERGEVWGGGFPLPTGEGAVPPPQKIFLTLDLKMSTSSAF